MNPKRLPKIRKRFISKINTMADEVNRATKRGAELTEWASHNGDSAIIVSEHIEKTKTILINSDGFDRYLNDPLVLDGPSVIDDWFVVLDPPIVFSSTDSVRYLVTSTRDAIEFAGEPAVADMYISDFQDYAATSGCLSEVVVVLGPKFILNYVCWLWDHRRTKMLSSMESNAEMAIQSKNLAITCASIINHHTTTYEPTDRGLFGETSPNESEPPPDYYVCKISDVLSKSIANGMGTKHGFEYDVRSHERKYSDGKRATVKAHRRGVNSGRKYVPKVYKV